MSTIQLDFQLPQRFELEYVGADNERHRPIMIHRALFGSIERFFAILIEHYAGAFPAWLAPVQVTVLPVADRHEEYAHEVVGAPARPTAAASSWSTRTPTPSGRASAGPSSRRCPYVLVVGDDDVEHGTVGVNRRGSDAPERGVAVDDFVARRLADVDVDRTACDARGHAA